MANKVSGGTVAHVAAAMAVLALFATGFIVFPKRGLRGLSKGLAVTILGVSVVDDPAGRFLEPGVVAERCVDHDPTDDEPEAPKPIEGIRPL